MLALEFQNIKKSFSNQTIVHDLSFDVKKGEFFSILGPSGCGKTTCLRLISGLEKPTSGIIRMNNREVNNLHPHKRNVHTVFQKYALFPHLNVFDNVAFGLRMKKTSETIIKQKVESMLEMVKLSDYSKRSILKLSGGEQQRVALIRALVNEPEILLLDEPLGALDLKLREQMQQELSSIQKKLGTTFIFVTHDQGEALTMSDRVAIMNQGRLEQIGSPTEVYETPKTLFVAKFVGTTNAFHGASSVDGSVMTLHCESYGPIKSNASSLYVPPTQKNKLSAVVRPEKIRIRSTTPDTHLETINFRRGTLVERTYLGSTTQIKIQIQENVPPLIALIANQSSSKMPNLKIGEKYYAVWDASDTIVVQ